MTEPNFVKPGVNYVAPEESTWKYVPVEPVSRWSHPYCCPVCGGRGTVHWGFYSGHTPMPETANGLTGTNRWQESCRSCGGSGVIWR